MIKKLIFDRRYIYAAIFGAVALAFQAFFMYKTEAAPRKRNLIIITKSPLQVISKWDTPDYYNTNPVCMADNISKILDTVHKEDYIAYKFNKEIIVNITSSDSKSDNSDLHSKALTSLLSELPIFTGGSQ